MAIGPLLVNQWQPGSSRRSLSVPRIARGFLGFFVAAMEPLKRRSLMGNRYGKLISGWGYDNCENYDNYDNWLVVTGT